MDDRHFDALARALGIPHARRSALTALLGGGLGLLTLAGPDAAAKKNKKRRRRRKRKQHQRRKKRTEACGDVCARGCPFSSIQDAIDAATAGATLRLCAGTHGEPLSITRDVTLIGAGAGEDGSILDGQGNGTVVDVAGGATVMLEGLRIIGGSGEGGGIHNRGALTLTNDTVTGHVADDGGGIYNDTTGILTLIDSSVTHNVVNEFGGGIYNRGTVTLNNSSVTDNATSVDGGGIYNESGGAVALNGTSSVTGNVAFVEGGGIYNSGVVTLNDDSRVTDNEPGNCDGGGTFSGNACGP